MKKQNNENHILVVLGSSLDFIDLVNSAQKRNIQTIVCDLSDNGPAKQIADKAVNISPFDVQAIANLVKSENADGIITSFSDILFESWVIISDKLGTFKSCPMDKLIYLRDKSYMKEMFEQLGIHFAYYKKIRKETAKKTLSNMKYPLVLKPADGYGSYGVYIVNTLQEAIDKIDEISQIREKNDFILAEEYLEGYECNVQCFIYSKKAYILEFADREKTFEPGKLPYISRMVYPSRYTQLLYQQVLEILEKVAAFCELDMGPLSMQFFLTQQKEIKVVEVAGRFLGYTGELFKIITEVNASSILLDMIYNPKNLINLLPENYHTKAFFSVIYFTVKTGIVSSLNKVKEVLAQNPWVVDSIIYCKEGKPIENFPYAARVTLKASSREYLDDITQELYDLFIIEDINGKNLICPNKITKYVY